jgi:hypothetical protein
MLYESKNGIVGDEKKWEFNREILSSLDRSGWQIYDI